MNRVAACALAVLFLAGCAAEPSEETVRKVLTDHFKGRGYRVISMELGTIRPITLGEKRYMGTRGYEVPVKSISLEVSADTASRLPGRTGERLIFKDATIKIREKGDHPGGWIIAHMSGIVVP